MREISEDLLTAAIASGRAPRAAQASATTPPGNPRSAPWRSLRAGLRSQAALWGKVVLLASRKRLLAIALLGAGSARLAVAQDSDYQVDPVQSSVQFTLGDVLHTVRGTFKVKQGDLAVGADGRVSGQIVVDAASGNSGSGMRDRKMQKEVLESTRYPDISFRADRIAGALSSSGKSSVMVHGIFNIHGADREITVPAQVETNSEHWTATVHFTVPYQKWGMKNPSTLFLRVGDTVEIDLLAAGTVVRHTARSPQ